MAMKREKNVNRYGFLFFGEGGDSRLECLVPISDTDFKGQMVG